MGHGRGPFARGLVLCPASRGWWSHGPWPAVRSANSSTGKRDLHAADGATIDIRTPIRILALRALEMLVPLAENRCVQTPSTAVVTDPPVTYSEEGTPWFETATVAAVVLFTGVAGFFALRMVFCYAALLRLLWRARSAPQAIQSVFESMTGDAKNARLLVSRRLALPLVLRGLYAADGFIAVVAFARIPHLQNSAGFSPTN